MRRFPDLVLNLPLSELICSLHRQNFLAIIGESKVPDRLRSRRYFVVRESI
jgi:hypothetical protein